MFSTLIKPLPLLFTLATTVGVLMHDTQLDRATTVAIALPAVAAGYAVIDSALKNSDGHTHVERMSYKHPFAQLRTTVPRLVPREDDRRSHQAKRIIFGVGDNTSLWPSV